MFLDHYALEIWHFFENKSGRWAHRHENPFFAILTQSYSKRNEGTIIGIGAEKSLQLSFERDNLCSCGNFGKKALPLLFGKSQANDKDQQKYNGKFHILVDNPENVMFTIF